MRCTALLVLCASASATATAPLSREERVVLRPAFVQMQESMRKLAIAVEDHRDLQTPPESDGNPAQKPTPTPIPVEKLKKMFYRSLEFKLGYVVLVLITAAVYQLTRVWPDPVPVKQTGRRQEKGKDLRLWSTGPLDCCDDCQGFCLAFLCTGVRLAENVSMLGLAGYWTVVIAFTLVTVAAQLVPLLWLVVLIGGIVWRQTFRKKFDMPGTGDCPSFADCLLYLCCMPCAVAQEARHLEEAAKANHATVREQRPVQEAMQV